MNLIMHHPVVILLLGALAFPTTRQAAALSSSTSSSRQFVELKKASSLPNDRLPASFISAWTTWILDPSTPDDPWTRIPDTDGFVPPASLDECWQPVDLRYPACRLAVGLHVRNGSIRHILPAVDLTLEGQDPSGINHLHRNRGLCSVPRAYEWMDFGSLALGGGLDACRLVLQTREKDQPTWITHTLFDGMGETINQAVEALTENPPEELGDDSCLIHVLCNPHDDADLSSIPPVGSDLRALLLEEDGTILGSLHVKIVKTAAGSESEYMPAAYSSLFNDESLRRPAFVEMKRRMDQKKKAND